MIFIMFPIGRTTIIGAYNYSHFCLMYFNERTKEGEGKGEKEKKSYISHLVNIVVYFYRVPQTGESSLKIY